MKIKRSVGIFISLMMVCALGVTTVMAANPHFTKANPSVGDTGNLIVSFKEAGLGKGQIVHYAVGANAIAVYACINEGGNIPQDPKKQTVTGSVPSSGDFVSGKNGQITASITSSPLPPPLDPSCPPGQKIVLACVDYSNITLIDTTNGVDAGIQSSISRAFYPICP
jgi:hypothetical protein